MADNPNPNRLDWFVTASGRRVFIESPDPNLIHIDDIAHALSKIARFGGHSIGDEIYSVAQHSVLVSRLVPQVGKLPLYGLLHDASEAYLGDVIRPLKRLLPQYKRIEDVWWLSIAHKFGLPDELPPEVKDADMRALATERRDLHPASDPFQNRDAWKWMEDERRIEPDPQRIVPLSPRVARVEFLSRWDEVSRPAWPSGGTR